MKAKEIILLILIIAAGVIFYHAYTGKFDFSIDFGDGIYWGLEEFTYEESQEVESPFPSLLRIVNSHGKIEIQGTKEQRITIDFQKKIWRKNDKQAREVSDMLKMVIDKNENQLRISTNRDDFRKKKFDTNFRISVPKGTNIEVENSYGYVKASKVGTTRINNRHGEIILSEIEGKIDAKNSYEDVEIEGAQSDCLVESKNSTIMVKNVKGGMKIIQQYGKIYLENITQEVEIESPNTEIYGYGLRGGMDIQNSYEKITLQNVGPTIIKGKNSRVEADGIQGYLKINDSYANLKLHNIAGSLYVDGKNVEISGRNIVKFFWPKGKKHPFEARAKGGEIRWNLPAEMTSTEENGTSIVKAFLQETGKPSVFLSTSYGEIVIEE